MLLAERPCLEQRPGVGRRRRAFRGRRGIISAKSGIGGGSFWSCDPGGPPLHPRPGARTRAQSGRPFDRDHSWHGSRPSRVQRLDCDSERIKSAGWCSTVSPPALKFRTPWCTAAPIPRPPMDARLRSAARRFSAFPGPCVTRDFQNPLCPTNCGTAILWVSGEWWMEK